MANALLLSASREGNTGYLEHAKPLISKFISDLELDHTPNIVFIPYAGVSVTFDQYFEMVKSATEDLDISLSSIHHFDSPQDAIASADIIFVGGGNTFALLDRLYSNDLVDTIKNAIDKGVGYIGWSAGSNIAGQSIKTTNDMPIVEPPSFSSLNLLPFQLNPHYTDYRAPGHNGETREMRLQEFMVLNPDMPVVGIQEGSALRLNTSLKSKSLILQGNKVGYVFLNGQKTEVPEDHDFSYLMGKQC